MRWHGIAQNSNYFPLTLVGPAPAYALPVAEPEPPEPPEPPAEGTAARAYTLRGERGRDTWIGGNYVLITAGGLDVSETEEPLRGGLPVGWTFPDGVTGSVQGLTLRTAPSGGSGRVGLSPISASRYRARVKAELLSPRVLAGGAMDVASLRGTADTTVARVTLALHETRGLYAHFGTAAIGPLDPYSIHELELIRLETEAWGLVDGQAIGHRIDLPEDEGPVGIESTNGALDIAVAVRFTDFVVGGAALIDGVPIWHDRVGPHSIEGRVPRTSSARRGPRDVVAFSPAGRSDGQNAFDYLRPPTLSIISRRGRPVLYASDLAVTQ